MAMDHWITLKFTNVQQAGIGKQEATCWNACKLIRKMLSGMPVRLAGKCASLGLPTLNVAVATVLQKKEAKQQNQE